MQPLKARVQDGRLVVVNDTPLPEGQVFELRPVESDAGWADETNWSAEARERLEGALERGSADAAAGRTVDAREFLDKLAEPR